MVKVVWSKRTFSQLERSIQYLREEQGYAYAEVVLNQILSSVKLLEKTPKLGVREPLLAHKKTEYRFLVVWSYKIIYKAESKSVVISRLFHTSRNPKKMRGV